MEKPHVGHVVDRGGFEPSEAAILDVQPVELSDDWSPIGAKREAECHPSPLRRLSVNDWFKPSSFRVTCSAVTFNGNITQHANIKAHAYHAMLLPATPPLTLKFSIFLIEVRDSFVDHEIILVGCKKLN